MLAWKTLHHYYNMHRQVSYVGKRPRVTALDDNPVGSPIATHPVSNPEWNTGVTAITPVIVRMQYLLSYGVKKNGEKDYDLHVYSYPVVTLWNPYNVDMRINGDNIWLHNLPLIPQDLQKQRLHRDSRFQLEVRFGRERRHIEHAFRPALRKPQSTPCFEGREKKRSSIPRQV